MSKKVAAKILIIDHNDSFTFNLVQLLEELKGCTVAIIHVDQVELNLLADYDGIILSPGPGLPQDHPKIFEALSYCMSAARAVPVLGICLGLQAIAVHLGGSLYNLGTPQHGTQVQLLKTAECALFEGLKFPLIVGRYHSWAVEPKTLSADLQITSVAMETSEPQVVMSLQHCSLPIFGLQFHPESYMSPQGALLLENWLTVVRQQKTRSLTL